MANILYICVKKREIELVVSCGMNATSVCYWARLDQVNRYDVEEAETGGLLLELSGACNLLVVGEWLSEGCCYTTRLDCKKVSQKGLFHWLSYSVQSTRLMCLASQSASQSVR